VRACQCWGTFDQQFNDIKHVCKVGVMECTCMLFTFENGVPLMR